MEFFFCQLSVEIHRTVFTSEMKSYILIMKSLMHKPGYDMLSGMLLHLHKTFRPVDLTLNTSSRFNRIFCLVIDFPILFLHIRHTDLI